jgi:N12 class adenine-specific DNA methylase/SAM-dependent methyltransferase
VFVAHFHLEPADLAFAGAGDRFQKNLTALRLLHDLTTTNRLATDNERRILTHYSAFGESALLNRLFRYDHTTGRYVLLPAYAEFLTPDAATHLRKAALTAFYTPLDLVHAIWQTVERLGFGAVEQPRILEPAAGVGHFISAMSPVLREHAQITAIELDPISGQMLGQIHPDITLHAGVGFEVVDLPTGWFDLVISNVPFGETSAYDPLVPVALRRVLHDYFFAKALRLLRPGGLLVFLTSWGTLDKRSSTVRQFLAEHATLLGAYRLPNGIFRQISGSESAIDLLILQKKAQPAIEDPSWLHTAEADYPRTPNHRSLTTGSRYTRQIADVEELAAARVAVNQYWLDNPACVLGQPQVVVSDQSLWLHVAPPAEDLATVLAERLAMVRRNALPPPPPPSALPSGSQVDQLDLAGVLPGQHARANGLVAIYDAAKALLTADRADDPASESLRIVLNQVYDTFVARFGVIHDPRNQRVLADVPELQFLLALERNAQRSASGYWYATKERLFTERTVRPQRPIVLGSLAPTDALLRCLNDQGRLDLAYIGELTGLPESQVINQLGERIYRLPGCDQYELDNVYLSGNVVAKLREAHAWAAHVPSLHRNVAALEAVQPTPLGPGEIRLNLHAFWLPGSLVTAFIQSLVPAWRGEATYQAALGTWVLTDPDQRGAQAVEAETQWGTPRANAITILSASLRGVPITVYDVITTDAGERRVLNPAETVAAQEKQHALAQHFEQWVWDDLARSDQLCRLYNHRFNSVRMRVYDGVHLHFAGINPHVLRDGDLADYQKAAVWQVLQNPTALLSFAVGGGKTFTAIAAAVEAKRLGLCHKPLAIVPNTLVGQWASEARRLYPGLRVLAMGPEDFERQRRGVVLSRIATGDWDLIVIAHTSFTLLPLSATLVHRFQEAETDRLRAYLEEQRGTATSSEDKRSLKQIERAILKLEQRLQGLITATRHDSERTITWDELGIDLLIVDEAHQFKNLYLTTRLTNIAGLPSAHSQRALDLRIKTWDLLQQQRKVVFLTATPIMNTLAEAYVMQLYLQQEQLEAVGIHHFDEWVSLYAQPRMAFELKPDSSGFRLQTRLASFINLPEMAALWRQVLTIRTKEQMALPEPQLVTGKLIPVVVPPSRALTYYIRTLATRAEAVRSGRIDPTIDNMLAIVTDGRKAALDIRLVIPQAPRPAQTKILALVERVAQIYHTFAPLRGTQLIFCDLATPKGKRTTPARSNEEDDDAPTLESQDERRMGHFVYGEIRAELIQRGIPHAEIAFIHDYTTKAQRDGLFAAMNEGRVRVLLGSTSMMSAGMNVQRRLIALHNLDCPWRPGDLEQRHGRILRQGNQWPEIYCFAYLTEGSFDGYSWQLIESKARFIAQALAGEITARTIDDTAEVVLSAAEIKAIASGNPQVLRKVQLETEIARLDRVRTVWRDTLTNLRIEHLHTTESRERLLQRVAAWEQAQTIAEAHPVQPFRVTLRQRGKAKVFTDRTVAGAALRCLLDQPTERPQTTVIGQYRGFDLVLRHHPAFPAELSLCLPAGDTLDTIATTTDAGIWQSANRLIQTIPTIIQHLQERIAAADERRTTIAREQQRLATWEGQAAYDAAVAALAQITATLTAADQPSEPTTTVASDTDETRLEALLRELAEEPDDRPADPVILPPAPASLACMVKEQERQQRTKPIDLLHPVPPPQRESRRSAPQPTFEQLSLFG